MNSGDALGPYQLIEPLGAGGMGEVWLARDPRLGRRVAVKVLPPAFAEDPDRLQRFELEAKAAAALNHPHIAAVYDVGRAADTPYIVQELLEGEPLGDTLAAGALAPARALTLAAEAAGALAAAHAAGVVHRDLKPDNIFVSPGGRAKLLDFGLAKEIAPRRRGSGSGPASASGTREPESSQDLSRTPTSPTPSADRMVGSVGYMSPEQIEGRAVDHRTDLFAIGCVLYEMLAGQHPFRGRSVHQTIDRVLHDEPEALAAAVPGLPALVCWIVDKCLAKDPAERYQGADDLEVDLRNALRRVQSGEGTPAPLPHDRGRLAAAGAAVLLLAMLAAGWLGSRFGSSPPTVEPVSRFFVNLPAGMQLALSNLPPLAISPDGARIAYVADHGGGTQIHVRDRSRFEGVPLDGTDGGSNPVFSPDGRWLGYFAGGRLRRISVSGGAPQVLADVSFQPQGMSWGDDGRVVYSASAGSGLWQVSADGGDPLELTTIDPAAGETSHRWPDVLPGAAGVLFVISQADHVSFDDATIAVRSAATGAIESLVQGTHPRYVPSGHIVFARAGSLLAVPFDVDRLTVTGPAALVIEGVAMRPLSGAAYYAVADAGTLAYVSGLGVAARSLVWVDRSGRETPAGAERLAYETPRLSLDARRVAVTIQPEGGSPDVWVRDLARGTATRLTFEGMNGFPVWSPDGRRVAFTSNRAGTFNIYSKAADGSDAAVAILPPGNARYPDSWSDAGVLVYTEDDVDTAADLWSVSLRAAQAPREVVRRPFMESSGAFSPDGRWLAYVSDESGREEVYVRGWGSGGGRWQISNAGGSEPAWSPDGTEIYYRSGNRVMAVALSGTGDLRVGVPVELFAGPYATGAAGSANYDVASDGRLLMVRSETATAPTLVNVVVNWFDELRSISDGG